MPTKKIAIAVAGLALLGISQIIPITSLSASAPAPVTDPAALVDSPRQEVMAWINEQAKDPVTTDSFQFQTVNLDDDDDMEIIAKHNGAVHIGSFYILDRQEDGSYKLIAEESWNVPRFQLDRWDPARYEDNSEWNSQSVQELGRVAGKRLFETINRTGGSGVDILEAHLWYLQDGKLVKAWSGTLQGTSSIPGGQLIQIAGSYQLVGADTEHPQLYTWQTTQELDPDTGLPLSKKAETTTEILSWNDGAFQKTSQK